MNDSCLFPFRRLFVFGALIAAVCSSRSILAEKPSVEVGTIFIRNNGKLTVNVWVGGYYQGYVLPGKTMYTVREGFVTRESGYLKDGTHYQRESHAGWPVKGSLLVSLKSADDKGVKYETEVRVDPATAGDEPSVWTGEESAGIAPGDLDRENAPQILKGNLADFAKPEEDLAPAKDRRRKLAELKEDVKALQERLDSAKKAGEGESVNDLDRKIRAAKDSLDELQDTGRRNVNPHLTYQNRLSLWNGQVESAQEAIKDSERHVKFRRGCYADVASWIQEKPSDPRVPFWKEMLAREKENVIDAERYLNLAKAELQKLGKNKPVDDITPKPNSSEVKVVKREIEDLELRRREAEDASAASASQIEAWAASLAKKRTTIAELEKELEKDKQLFVALANGFRAARQERRNAERDKRSLLDDVGKVGGDSATEAGRPAGTKSLLDDVTQEK